ncbi:Gfo/Idh/MocA family oxidoreductase [Lachnospiraceae bacterium 62-35]
MDILVIGLGSMGKRRIRLLCRFKQIGNIIGVDFKENRRKDSENMFSCKTYTDIHAALAENPQIKCAFVCTSPLSHSGLITEALQYGLHVFTEINLVSDGYERNISLAKQKSRVLFLSSTFYYREEIRFIREKIKGKGNLNYLYHIGQYLPDWHPWENYNEFFVGDKRTNGCREIMAIEFPWIIGTFGMVRNYNVIANNISELNIPYKDNYFIQLEHESGNKGVLAIDVVSPKAVRNLEVYGENLYFSWNGSPAGLEYFDFENKTMKRVCPYDDIEQLEGYSNFIIENAYQAEIQEFLALIKGKNRPEYGFEEDLEILKLIDQIEGLDHE